MKLVHWINLLLLAGLFAFAASTFGELPERIPVHFGPDGQPTRWSRPSLLAWFGLPLLTAATAAFIYWTAQLLPRKPHLISMPDKHRFLALPAARRAAVIERVQEFAYWATAPTILVMGAVQWSMYQGAVTGTTGRNIVVILVMSALVGPLLMIFWSARVESELERQLREQRAEEQAAG